MEAGVRITWLNNERTLARVSRGIWPWRKIAVVQRVGYEKWQHLHTCDPAEDWLSRAMEWRSIQEAVALKLREHERRNWMRRNLLPRAEVRR